MRGNRSTQFWDTGHVMAVAGTGQWTAVHAAVGDGQQLRIADKQPSGPMVGPRAAIRHYLSNSCLLTPVSLHNMAMGGDRQIPPYSVQQELLITL